MMFSMAFRVAMTIKFFVCVPAIDNALFGVFLLFVALQRWSFWDSGFIHSLSLVVLVVVVVVAIVSEYTSSITPYRQE